ncbi:YfiR family protein [Rugamonas sp. CCM 8940]|uniref:YfiR family protein n=1 Tax=Rugamonas sp. CCM 8940 TaxID=2765359 RepID=UPI0018F77D6A|nr:YfiR family protein [Rugamonas sp. CCM 8940]MBJ7309600.1 YfiR family protein [Rugamonas sp. CCM 8940]
MAVHLAPPPCPLRCDAAPSAAPRLTALSLAVLLLLGMPAPAARAQSAAQVSTPTADARRGQEVARVVAGINSYVRWPAPHPQTLVCVFGNTRYADALLDPAGGGHLRAIRAVGDHEDMPGACQIAYLGALGAFERDRLMAHLIGRPVLSISEANPNCAAGGMFCLKFRDNQLAFEVDLDAVARSGLRVHPNVLLLAKRKAATP